MFVAQILVLEILFRAPSNLLTEQPINSRVSIKFEHKR